MVVSILVMNEDSSRDAYFALEHIVRRICQLICPTLQTQHLKITPTPPELVGCVRAGQWKSSNPRDRQRQVELVQSIANQLAISDGFVAFHYDGDQAWKDRARCSHDEPFERLVRTRVRAVLQLRLASNHDDHDVHEVIDNMMSKLLMICPYYSLESWTYQNTARARVICQELDDRRGLSQLDEWELDPGLLDEVVRVADMFPLGKAHNATLTERAWPADRVYAVGKSFTAAVDAAMECRLLGEALARISGSAR